MGTWAARAHGHPRWLGLFLRGFQVKHQATREDWLNAVAQRMRPMFEAAGAPLPERFRVTMSLTKRAKAIGMCFDASASADGTFEILIRLDQCDPLEVAAILAHELVHAAVGIKEGHGGRFRAAALRIGLEGKMTATRPGDAFKTTVAPILAAVGPFPHAALDWAGERSGPKKQGTRLLKVKCGDCGYTCRVTAKWLESTGAPLCPCNDEEMQVA